MIFIVIAIIVFWKVVKRSKFLKPEEVDLHSDLADIDEYTQDFNERERMNPVPGGTARLLAKIW